MSASPMLPRKLLVVITSNGNGDRSTVGMTAAAAALSSGMQVGVFLTSDGVELAREGACDLTHVRPFRPLAELLEEFVKSGGTLLACGSCLQYRGIQADLPGVQVSGIGALVSWLSDGAQTLSF